MEVREMVIILVLMTFMIAMLVNALVVQRVTRKQAEKVAKERFDGTMVKADGLKPSRVAGLAFASDVQYHPGHTWVNLHNAIVPIGADDFTCKFVGRIDRIETLPVGVEVKRGQPIWRVLFGDRWIVQRAPVSGRIVVVNQKVLKNPDGLSESPYGDRWIVKMLPESLCTESAKLFGKESFMQIADRALSKLLGQLKPALGAVYTDSGALVRGAARQIEEEKWEEISEELFNSDPGED